MVFQGCNLYRFLGSKKQDILSQNIDNLLLFIVHGGTDK
jgi:hypothetical protein